PRIARCWLAARPSAQESRLRPKAPGPPRLRANISSERLPNAEEKVEVRRLLLMRQNRRTVRMRAVSNHHGIHRRVQRIAEVQADRPDWRVISQPQSNPVRKVIEITGPRRIRA